MPAQLEVDQNASIDELAVSVLSTQGLQLQFECSQKPRWLFFRVTQVMGAKRSSAVSELVFTNFNSRFGAGLNQLLIGPLSPDPLGREIGKNIKPGYSYVINVAESADASRWGAIQSTTFAAP